MTQMESNEQADVDPVEGALPGCLDEIITRNRDIAKLYLASDVQVARLSRIIPVSVADDLRGAVADWRLIAFEVCLPGQEPHASIHLLGDNARRGVGTKITSALTGIDLGTRLVSTASGSIYRLVGERGLGEPTLLQRLQICGAFWSWGRGAALGVVPIWY